MNPMDCAKTADLLSAMLDGECDPGERTAVEAHIASCPSCRLVREEVESMDRRLRRSFAPRRESASRLADRVIAELGSPAASPPRRWTAGRIIPLLLSAAAGFLLAVVLFRPGPEAPKPAAPAPPVAVSPVPGQPPAATLTVASGAIEVRKPGSDSWEVLASGGSIEPGTRVRTGPKERCEFRTAEGSEVRLNGDTEVLFQGGRNLEIAAGQIWSSVAKAIEPYEVRVPLAEAKVTALGTRFDILCEKRQAVLTVEEGTTRVEAKGDVQLVKVGERAKISGGAVQVGPVRDMVLATSWVNEVLVLKGRDDKELSRRLNDLFARLGEEKMTYLYEKEIISLGDHCVIPLSRFIQSERSSVDEHKRRSAARILGEIAPGWAIPELISLLADEDGEVRLFAARRLEKLTREDQGMTPEGWRDQGDPASRKTHQEKWRAFWEANKEKYPGAP